MASSYLIQGVEAELAVTSREGEHRRGPSGLAMSLARELFDHVGDGGKGIFLTNGSHLTEDCEKLEVGTPETCHPADLLRTLQACMSNVETLLEAGASCGMRAFRVNVGYGPQKSTWGFHHSVSHQLPLEDLIGPVTAYLISRLPLTGVGGFDNTSAGIEFSLSPRVPHLKRPVSSDSTSDRGIFHTKNESLSRGHSRLHTIVGETPCSETSAYASVSILPLLVKALHCRRWDDVPTFRRVVPIMQKIARDRTGTYTFSSADGARWNAQLLQSRVVDFIESVLDDPIMPRGAESIIHDYRTLLSQARYRGESLDQTLDWRIKFQLFKRQAACKGFTWEDVENWSAICRRIQTVACRSLDPGIVDLTVDLIAKTSPIHSELMRLTRKLDQHNFRWEQLEPLLDLRQCLFAIDLCYGELGPQGIFHQLDRAGVLHHRLVNLPAPCFDPTNEAPPDTRARVRGEMIRQVASRNQEYVARWDGISQPAQRRRLSLSNGYQTTIRWEEPWDLPERLIASFRTRRTSTLGFELYSRGHYQTFCDLHADGRAHCDTRQLETLDRIDDWCRARLGQTPRLGPSDSTPATQLPFWALLDRAFRARFASLTLSAQFRDVVEACHTRRSSEDRISSAQVAVHLEHYGLHLMTIGRNEEARAALEESVERLRSDSLRFLTVNRARVTLSELARRQNERPKAAQILDKAHQALVSKQAYGELAEFVLPQKARDVRRTSEARDFLLLALKIQTDLGHDLRRVRTLALLGRVEETEGGRNQRLREIERLAPCIPGVAEDPELQRITSSWSAWCATPHDAVEDFSPSL